MDGDVRQSQFIFHNHDALRNVLELLDSFVGLGPNSADEVRTIVNFICNLSCECEEFTDHFVTTCGVIEKLVRVLQYNHAGGGTCRDNETELNVVRTLGNIMD